MNLLILSTPRTGSNAFCECLTSGRVMGNVEGYFVGWGDNIVNEYEQRNQGYIDNHAHNGNFATKVMWDYLDHIADRKKQPGLIPAWLQSFDRVLWLRREDTVAQAVSWFVALGSGKWTSANEKKRDWPDYDYHRIAHHLGMIEGYNARTQTFIKTAGKRASEMSYEYMVNNGWQTSAQKLFEWCGLRPDAISEPTLQKQDNPLKGEYIERFRHDMVKAQHDS